MSDYLKRLGTLAEYNTFKDSDDFVTPSVVYVDELDASGHHIHIAHETYKFGHILMYDKVNKFKFGCTIDQYEAKYKSNTTQYEPQALCVIPTGLLDNYARFISIGGQTTKYWSDNTSWKNNNHSSADSYKYHYKYDVPGLTNRTNIRPLIAMGNTSSVNTAGSSWACTPMDRKKDWGTTYTSSNPNLVYRYDASWQYTNPLFNTDWSLNTEMFNDNASTNSYLMDRDGLSNTVTLMGIHNSTVTFTNGVTETIEFPAAEYCWNYQTTAVKQHSWYLPSITELSLGLCRYDTIQNLLGRITGASQLVSSDYWSSTECDSIHAADFLTRDGYIGGCSKYYGLYVRPFCRF